MHSKNKPSRFQQYYNLKLSSSSSQSISASGFSQLMSYHLSISVDKPEAPCQLILVQTSLAEHNLQFSNSKKKTKPKSLKSFLVTQFRSINMYNQPVWQRQRGQCGACFLHVSYDFLKELVCQFQAATNRSSPESSAEEDSCLGAIQIKQQHASDFFFFLIRFAFSSGFYFQECKGFFF